MSERKIVNNGIYNEYVENQVNIYMPQDKEEKQPLTPEPAEEAEMVANDENLHTSPDPVCKNDLAQVIAGSFYGDVDKANEFLNIVKNMKKDTQITNLVKQWIKKNWISSLSCNIDLWEPLHENGLYRATQKNWDKMIK